MEKDNSFETKVVNIIRCKDCKLRKTDECAMSYHDGEFDTQYSWESDNDFCSWAVEKDR